MTFKRFRDFLFTIVDKIVPIHFKRAKLFILFLNFYRKPNKSKNSIRKNEKSDYKIFLSSILLDNGRK